MRKMWSSVVVLAAAALAFETVAQSRPTGRGGGGSQQASESSGKKDGIKPYDEVITDEAVTDTGLFVIRFDSYLITACIFYPLRHPVCRNVSCAEQIPGSEITYFQRNNAPIRR